MTVEQREQMMAQLPEPQRRQLQAAQMAMADITYLSEQIKPSKEAPDAPISTFTLIKAIATCPSMKQIDEVTPGDKKVFVETVDKMEAALREAGAFDAEAVAACQELTRPQRRNVNCLYWAMYQVKLEKLVELDDITGRQQQICTQIGTGILVKAQMLIVQNRWVQAVLAIARVSALISCRLWSHTDAEALEKMAEILKSDECASEQRAATHA